MAFNMAAALSFSAKGVKTSLGDASREMAAFRAHTESVGASFKDGTFSRGIKAVQMASLGLIAGIAGSAGAYALFEKPFNKAIRKISDGKENISLLDQQMQMLAVTSSSSASEIAAAYAVIGKEGYNTREALAVMPAITALANAGSLDLSKTVNDVSDSVTALSLAMSQYGDKAAQTNKLVDMLGYVQSKMNVSTESLTGAFLQSGVRLTQFGMSASEVVGTLALLEDRGIKAEGAAKGLEMMYSKLAMATKDEKSFTKLASLGVNLRDMTDSTGKLKSLPVVMGMLKKAIDSHPNALVRSGAALEIFGMRGVKIFENLSRVGTDEMSTLFKHLEESDGESLRAYKSSMDSKLGFTKQFWQAAKGIYLAVGERMTKLFSSGTDTRTLLEPVQQLAFAMITLNKPLKDWNDEDKKLMSSGIGLFVQGLNDGLTGTRDAVVGLIAQMRSLNPDVQTGGVNFREYGKQTFYCLLGFLALGPAIFAVKGAISICSTAASVASGAWWALTGAAKAFNVVMAWTKLDLVLLRAQLWGLEAQTWLCAAAKSYWGFVMKANMAILGGLTTALKWFVAVTRLDVVWTWACTAAKWAWTTAVAIGSTVAGGFTAALAAMGIAQKASSIWTWAVTAATWAFNAALWANPLTWIVAGVLAAVVAIGLLIYYWKEVTTAVKDCWLWLGNWKYAIFAIMGPIGWLIGAGVLLYEKWDAFCSVFKTAWTWISKLWGGGNPAQNTPVIAQSASAPVNNPGISTSPMPNNVIDFQAAKAKKEGLLSSPLASLGTQAGAPLGDMPFKMPMAVGQDFDPKDFDMSQFNSKEMTQNINNNAVAGGPAGLFGLPGAREGAITKQQMAEVLAGQKAPEIKFSVTTNADPDYIKTTIDREDRHTANKAGDQQDFTAAERSARPRYER